MSSIIFLEILLKKESLNFGSNNVEQKITTTKNILIHYHN